MATDVQHTLGPAGEYSLMSTWEANELRDLVALDETETLVCTEFPGGLSDSCTVDGWTDSNTNFIQIEAAPGSEVRIDGAGLAGFYMTAANSAADTAVALVSRTNTCFLTAIGLIQQSRQATWLNNTRGSNLTARHDRCIFINTNTVPAEDARGWRNRQNINGYARNCFIGTRGNSSASYSAIVTGVSSGFTFSFQNCTLVAGLLAEENVRVTGNQNRVVFTNVVSYAPNGTGFPTATWAAGTSNNASSDATAPGAGSQQDITSAAFEDFDNNDYAPASGGPLAGTGADLSATFTVDQNGDTRTVPWTIGAYIAGGAAPGYSGGGGGDFSAAFDGSGTGTFSEGLPPLQALPVPSPQTYFVGQPVFANIGNSFYGGVPPLTYSIVGQLPDGIDFDPNTGAITGTPTTVQTVQFAGQATDSSTPVPDVETTNTITVNIETPTEGGGIFFGEDPVTDLYFGSDPVTEVYFGSVKVWPAVPPGPGYESFYGSKVLGYDPYNFVVPAAIFYSSKPGAYSVEGSFNGLSTVTWDAVLARWGGFGYDAGPGSFQPEEVERLTFYTKMASAAQSTSGSQQVRKDGSGVNASNSLQLTRFLVSNALSDGTVEDYLRVLGDGTVVWSTTAGWSVVRTSAGRYTVTAPRDFLTNGAAITIHGSTIALPCTKNWTANSFDIEIDTALPSTQNPVDAEFSMQAYLI